MPWGMIHLDPRKSILAPCRCFHSSSDVVGPGKRELPWAQLEAIYYVHSLRVFRVEQARHQIEACVMRQVTLLGKIMQSDGRRNNEHIIDLLRVQVQLEYRSTCWV